MRSDYLHATAIVWKEIGILIMGDAGSGKSSLAAELITRGANLVADDQVKLTTKDGKLYANTPEALAGVIELRNIGLIRLPFASQARVHFIVECTAHDSRLTTHDLLHLTLPKLMVNPHHTDSAAKLILYAEALQEGRVLPEDWRPGV